MILFLPAVAKPILNLLHYTTNITSLKRPVGILLVDLDYYCTTRTIIIILCLYLFDVFIFVLCQSSGCFLLGRQSLYIISLIVIIFSVCQCILMMALYITSILIACLVMVFVGDSSIIIVDFNIIIFA